MGLQTAQSSTPVTVGGNNTSESLLNQPAKSDLRKKEVVEVTKCLSQKCTGVYTDTISESILILCKDPKHDNQKQSAGQAQPRPAAEDASSNQTKANLHGKEVHT